jgi:hypothetical protein
MTKAYEEVIDFIATLDSRAVADFHPSQEAKACVCELLALEKSQAISPEERSELDHYLQLEHTMRLAKARAKSVLSQ